MRKELLTLSLALGILSLPQSLLAGGDIGNTRTFSINVPQEGAYYCGIWLMPTSFADGRHAQYEVSINGSNVGTITPEKEGWQSIGIDDCPRVNLKKGNNILAVTSNGYEIPEAECVKVGNAYSDVQFDADDYDTYLYKARCTATETNKATISDNVGENQTDVHVYSANDNNTLIVDTELPLKYSFYKVYSFNKGQSVYISTTSALPHAVDIFYIGKEKTLTPINGARVIESYSSMGASTTINKDKFIFLYEHASSDEMQGLSWKRISTDEKESKPYSDFSLLIPKSGYYMIKLRSLHDEVLGTADISIYATKKASSSNLSPLPIPMELGTFKEVPIYYSRADLAIPSNIENLAIMTRAGNDGDPMLFVEGNAGKRIVGYNDDVDADDRNEFSLSSLDSYIEQIYKINTSDIHIVNTSSLSPETTCHVVYGFKSDLAALQQKQKLAKLSDICDIEPNCLQDIADANGWERVELFNGNGKKIFVNNSGNTSFPSLPSGFYIVKVLLENGKFNIYKINI